MKSDMKLEEAMKRLSEIVTLLENGNADLDESLKQYEEGVALIRLCNEKLDHAEQKVRLLKINVDGSAEEKPFSEESHTHE